MLIPFRSRAVADFYMFDHHVKPLFELMGKPFTPQGAISGQDALACATTLARALAVGAAAVTNSPQADPSEAADPLADDCSEAAVGLNQRAFSLLQMLRLAGEKNVDVVWGSYI
jgi:Domain of unknown function (DUF1840)